MSSVSFSSLGLNMPFPELRDKFSGRLIIASSGRTVWDDLEKAGVVKFPVNQHDCQYDIMCVNDMIQFFPGYVAHAYSNDHVTLPHWVKGRRRKFLQLYGDIKHIHTNKTQPAGIKANIWPFPGHGSSGLNAVYLGLALGYDEIWLCGIPLDNSGHFFDAPWVKSNFVNEVSQRNDGPKYWNNAKQRIFNNRVKSFSGRTRDLLGEPEVK